MAADLIVDEIKVIDVDTHITEPFDVFTSRVSKKWGDKVPHARRGLFPELFRYDPTADPNEPRDVWFLNGIPSYEPGHSTMAGWNDWPPSHPTTLEEFDPAAYDPHKRLERMDEYGMWAQVLYPNVAGFGGQNFLKLDEPELMLECVEAYNNFLAEWCGVDPNRLIPICSTPYWNLEQTLKEVERARKIGHKGILFPQSPQAYGDQPMLADPHWEPLWSLAEDLEMSINFHIGSGEPITDTKFEGNGNRANYSKSTMMTFMANIRGISEVLISGILHRHPKMKLVSVESGVGWIPFMCEALDWQWMNCGAFEEHPDRMLPSEYFERQVYGCFWFETKNAVDVIARWPNNILYETDFPHPTSMSPGPASRADVPKDFVQKLFSQIPEEPRRKVLHDNAAKLYHMN